MYARAELHSRALILRPFAAANFIAICARVGYIAIHL
jgi:hypothetical protein